jgi:ABC transporter substrate binding protein
MRRRDFIKATVGSAAAWPLAARGQQSAMPLIGFLSSRSAEDSSRAVVAFRQGIAKLGYNEGRNVLIEFRWAQGQFDRLPRLAAELVLQPVTVLAAVAGAQSPRAAMAATSTIPIVFGIGEDPVKEGLVLSLNRPGGNVSFAHFTQPYQPSPKWQSGRPAHRPFRGLLGVHSRYGLHTRAVTVYRDTLSEGFSHFVTSMTAPVASGWSVCRVGLAPTGKRRLFTAHTRSRHWTDQITS